MCTYLFDDVSQSPWIICIQHNPQRVVDGVVIMPPSAVAATGEEKLIWLTRYIIFREG
jgi:hypothetical protein